MDKAKTFSHWTAWIVVHLGRLLMAIVIVAVIALYMAFSIAISIGKGGK